MAERLFPLAKTCPACFGPEGDGYQTFNLTPSVAHLLPVIDLGPERMGYHGKVSPIRTNLPHFLSSGKLYSRVLIRVFQLDKA